MGNRQYPVPGNLVLRGASASLAVLRLGVSDKSTQSVLYLPQWIHQSPHKSTIKILQLAALAS